MKRAAHANTRCTGQRTGGRRRRPRQGVRRCAALREAQKHGTAAHGEAPKSAAQQRAAPRSATSAQPCVRSGAACADAAAASLMWRKSGAHHSSARAPSRLLRPPAASRCPGRVEVPRRGGDARCRCGGASVARRCSRRRRGRVQRAGAAPAGRGEDAAARRAALARAGASPAADTRPLLSAARRVQCKTGAPRLTCTAARCTRSRPSCAPRHASAVAAAWLRQLTSAAVRRAGWAYTPASRRRSRGARWPGACTSRATTAPRRATRAGATCPARSCRLQRTSRPLQRPAPRWLC